MRKHFFHRGTFVVSVLFFAAASLWAAQDGAPPSTITIPSGVPLHIEVSRTVALRRGQPVEATLTAPVYLIDRVALLSGAKLTGVVTGYEPIDKEDRLKARLDGDMRPLHKPVVTFDSISFQGNTIAIRAVGHVWTTEPVRFVAKLKRPSLIAQVKAAVHGRIASTKQIVFGPGKRDRALMLLYSQLPYHPQRIWQGTSFIAELADPISLASVNAVAPATSDSTANLDTIHVTARLLTAVSSNNAKKSDTVTAAVTVPVFDPQNRLLIAEGALLTGTVLKAQPSKSFGRNGQVRFLFDSVIPPGEDARSVNATITGAEANRSQNLSIDNEGGVKAAPDRGRLVAPALLAVLAVAGHERDGEGSGLGRQTVAANGFGLAARVVALTVNDPNVATAFGAYAFAKSIYFRFLARGHAVVFPRDTVIEAQLTFRSPQASRPAAKQG